MRNSVCALLQKLKSNRANKNAAVAIAVFGITTNEYDAGKIWKTEIQQIAIVRMQAERKDDEISKYMEPLL